MPAESMKTASLVVRSDRPRVAQAASESLMPTMTRPNGPRRRASTPMDMRANTTARKMVNDLGEVMWSPKIEGFGTDTEPLNPKMADHGNRALSHSVANAMVKRAR